MIRGIYYYTKSNIMSKTRTKTIPFPLAHLYVGDPDLGPEGDDGREHEEEPEDEQEPRRAHAVLPLEVHHDHIYNLHMIVVTQHTKQLNHRISII